MNGPAPPATTAATGSSAIAIDAAGRGLVQDAAEARRWYERGLAAGHGDNGFFLGLLYEAGGPGLPVD